jgi:CheY-like chemotaxis protein
MIINARQAMAESPRKIIRLESGKMGNQAFLRISDTGCGISKEDLKAIFEPFYTTKGHQEGRKTLGTGLGLAISHTIIADHGGQIDVESEARRGSTFTIWLPLETEGITVKPKEITEEINLQDLRVLIVEDEKDIQAIIQKSLEVKGALVEATDRGKKGFKLIKDNRYEVVLLDLQIPDLQGEELLDMINKLPDEQQPVKVIITGKATIEDVQELKRLQVADILFKPFELEELYATLAAATSGLKQKVGPG